MSCLFFFRFFFSTPAYTLKTMFSFPWDMIVVTVFLSILNQMEFHLVQKRKENCHRDHIPFNVIGKGNIVFSVRLVNSPINLAQENLPL